MNYSLLPEGPGVARRKKETNFFYKLKKKENLFKPMSPPGYPGAGVSTQKSAHSVQPFGRPEGTYILVLLKRLTHSQISDKD